MSQPGLRGCVVCAASRILKNDIYWLHYRGRPGIHSHCIAQASWRKPL